MNDKNIQSQIDALENTTTHALSGLDRKGLKVMEKNRKTAEKAKVWHDMKALHRLLNDA